MPATPPRYLISGQPDTHNVPPMPDHIRSRVEVRLYEAYRKRVGIRLTADDVDQLLRCDDAFLARITNVLSDNEGNANGTGSGTESAAALWHRFHAHL